MAPASGTGSGDEGPSMPLNWHIDEDDEDTCTEVQCEQWALLRDFHMYHLLGSSQEPRSARTVIISIFKMIKRRLHEIMYFAQGHTQLGSGRAGT